MSGKSPEKVAEKKEASNGATRRELLEVGSALALLVLRAGAAQANQWTTADKHFHSIVRLEPRNPFGDFYLGQSALFEKLLVQSSGPFPTSA